MNDQLIKIEKILKRRNREIERILKRRFETISALEKEIITLQDEKLNNIETIKNRLTKYK